MSDIGQDLRLRCPACAQTFGVPAANPPPSVLHVACDRCGHVLSTDEILNAMAASLNDLLEKARHRLTSMPPGKA